MNVFFYGLFMDEDLLRSKGLDPRLVGIATVEGHRLEIGERATIRTDPGASVEGVVLELDNDELERLYADLPVYVPVTITALLRDGRAIGAACYVLGDDGPPGPPNAEYIEKLRALARTLGLTPEYIASI